MRIGHSLAFILLTTLTFTIDASAASSTQPLDFSIPQPYVSARALGMGNAFVAVADDYSAMFYNPAGLARLKQYQLNFEIQGMVDKGILPFIKDVQDAAKKNDPNEINNLLTKNFGKHYSARLPTVGAYWAWPHWGLALIPADVSEEIEAQSAGPGMQVVANQDTTLALSYSRNPKWFKKDKVSYGVTVKGMYRANYSRYVVASDLILDPKIVNFNDATEGLTVDADAGLLYTPDTTSGFWKFAKYTKPTFGMAIRNIADYGFTQDLNLYTKVKGDQPPKLQRRLDVGTMLELPDWWVFKSRFAFDVRDIGYSNWTFTKGLHAGVEFNWKLAGWFQGGWRAGLNQGYWTAGFTGKIGVFMLDLASYGEEVGSSETKQENRRYMARASLDF